MRHDYLRKSMVDRIERKTLLAAYQRSVAKDVQERSLRPNRAQHLRSQSVLDHISSVHSQTGKTVGFKGTPSSHASRTKLSSQWNMNNLDNTF